MDSSTSRPEPERLVQAHRTIPPWVGRLVMPVWISDFNQRIVYINERAERLLGIGAEECIGRPCYRVVCGKNASGKSFCRAGCSTLRRVKRGVGIEPYALRIGGKDRGRWVRVVLIPTGMNGGDQKTQLIHCIVPDGDQKRFKKYLSKVVTRTPKAGLHHRTFTNVALTPREKEVLRMLSEDVSLHAISDRLHLSYSTVRNHVQHILGKLGVHSIMEAVAFYLLNDE
jgi:DNA-binding CsgD family transcriptional regulator